MRIRKSKLFVALTMIAILMFMQMSIIISEVKAEDITGSEGDVSWSLDSESGILTFSGSGSISDAWKKDITSYSDVVKSIDIEGDGITDIGVNAFVGCFYITSVTLPNSITSIGDRAFSCCNRLESISIPNNTTNIGNEVFEGSFSLTSITVEDSNLNYKDIDGILFDKQGTTIIAYPAGKTDKVYVIPDSVTNIGNSSFYSCYSLTSITIPDSVTSIGEHAFSNCNSLTSIIIPDSVTSIGNNAFSYCDSLTNITIPDNVTSIGSNAFSNCNSLTSITVENLNLNFKDINGVLLNKEGTVLLKYPNGRKDELYVIPNTVTSIGNSAFSNCNSLTSIIIPESVASIKNFAFSDCNSLKSIIIPDSVTSIGNNAFSYCDSLTIYCTTNSYIKTYAEDAEIPYVIDDIAPTIELTKKGKYIKITAADTGVGLAEAAYSLDGINWYENNELAVNESDTFTVYVKDKLGNINQDTIFIDVDKPIIESLSFNNNKIQVIATDNESGLAKEAYSIDNTTWQTNNEFVITEKGTYTIYVRDVQGNIAKDSIVITEIKDSNEEQDSQDDQDSQNNETPDTEAPTITLEVSNNVIKVIATDTGVGLADKAYSLDGVNWQESNELIVTKTGKYMVYVKDKSGNIANKLAVVENITHSSNNENNENEDNKTNTQEDTNKKPTNIKDGSESPDPFGQYGNKTFISLVIILVVISLIAYSKYKKYNLKD